MAFNVGLAIKTRVRVGALVKNAMPKRVFSTGGIFVSHFVGEGKMRAIGVSLCMQ
jgi:hypothetical protein